MSLPAMRFIDFFWPKNPAKLHISSKRQVNEVSLPFLQSSFQDLGSKYRVISGEGVFLGSKASDSFQHLSSLLAQGKSGTLVLPALPPLSAALVQLDLLEDSSPNALRYSFEFWEVSGDSVDASDSLPYVSVSAGDNVWSVAYRHGCSYDQILALNPHIQWPNFFPSDDWLVIP